MEFQAGLRFQWNRSCAMHTTNDENLGALAASVSLLDSEMRQARCLRSQGFSKELFMSLMTTPRNDEKDQGLGS
jgi:hypothetical protein